jgi:hypothetical protein
MIFEGVQKKTSNLNLIYINFVINIMQLTQSQGI